MYWYGQAVVDYRSRYGDIIPIRSRKKVGWAFGEFCNRHFVPRILIRDNIPENIGGALAEECHRRGVKSAFICPYTPEQNYAEGYLGRVTAMAPFAMVYSGAPMHLWRYCIICAVFVNNITATYFSKEKIWASPFELVHKESYPDSGIVVPFGCGCLVLLKEEEREKFKPRCALTVFLHYAINHPLYTYAVYSPKTKRVLFRQDVIFLTNVFPMREARVMGKLEPDGDKLITYRSKITRTTTNAQDEDNTDDFGPWTEQDDLPLFEDHVSGFNLVRPHDDSLLETLPRHNDWPTYVPDHPSFGPKSCIEVPVILEVLGEQIGEGNFIDDHSQETSSTTLQNQSLDDKSKGNEDEVQLRRSQRRKDTVKQDENLENKQKAGPRKPVKQRWYYEAVVPTPFDTVQEISPPPIGSDKRTELLSKTNTRHF